MIQVALILHVLASVTMILVVLLQTGKGAELGAAFGGASKAVFGPRGAAGPLAKVTVAAAVLFMLTSLYLTYAMKNIRANSLVDDLRTPAPITQPVTETGDQPSGDAPIAPVVPATPTETGSSSSDASPVTPPSTGNTETPAPAGGGDGAPSESGDGK